MSLYEKISRRAALRQSGAALATIVSFPSLGAARTDRSLNTRMSGDIAPVHDPCIIRQGGTYHLFCTGGDETQGYVPWRTSTDLLHWERRGAVFAEIPQWARDAVPGTRSIWAPDISHFNGRYHLYYTCSTFGSNRSVIGLATNATLDPDSADYEWRDQGLVVRSGPDDDYNAIDANHIEDRQGRHWLSFGSFWSGIKLLRLDPATGKPPSGASTLHSLASRPAPAGAPGAIEAPFMIERNGAYYLFVSFDYCCKGARSNYYIVVGRSETISGPYLGRDGRSLMDGYGAVVLRNDTGRYRGPGHCAVLKDTDGDYLAYHAYDSEKDGVPTLRISPIDWTEDGWPQVAL